MNTHAREETEAATTQGVPEKRVETVDYTSSPGQGQEMRRVVVVHQSNHHDNPTTSGGILAGAAASVASTLEFAKDAVSGKNRN
ncbi:hypothetical protein OIU84_029861 [Salix udensis]|uniref:Uncharacterized protein n=1 Tax=Salix udensis TaxID=889485 RepID=A0AAD6P7S1_9ROSI|nr:hypothetical protein OIU84_029861 [Salix udensis]